MRQRECDRCQHCGVTGCPTGQLGLLVFRCRLALSLAETLCKFVIVPFTIPNLLLGLLFSSTWLVARLLSCGCTCTPGHRAGYQTRVDAPKNRMLIRFVKYYKAHSRCYQKTGSHWYKCYRGSSNIQANVLPNQVARRSTDCIIKNVHSNSNIPLRS